MGSACSHPKVYEPDAPARVDEAPTVNITPSTQVGAATVGAGTLGGITNTGVNLQTVARAIVGDIKFTALIGVGGYGRVYRALWNGSDVAVKVVAHAVDQPWDDEAMLSQSLRHPNVVSTYVYTNDRAAPSSLDDENEETSVIVMEFCDKGGLAASIVKKVFWNDEGVLNYLWVLLTLRDVAAGVAYLHTIKVLHGDLNTNNVLLCSKSTDPRGFIAKVADFGMSRTFHTWQTTHKSTTHYGTLTHVPPELLSHGKLSPKADMYAFGIIMHELYTGLKPYDGCHWGTVVAAVMQGDRPQFPPECPKAYTDLAASCWQNDKNDRPMWNDIMGDINTLLAPFKDQY